MSNRIRIARGSQANLPSDLMYGEFYWQKVASGSEGVLYMGAPDGSTAPAVAIGGARAMKSWYYKGIWSTAGSFPSSPVMGDMYLVGVDGSGSLAAFKTGDMMIYDGTSSWLRINNVGGNASQTSYTNTLSGLSATSAQDAIDELAAKRFQFGGTFSAAGAAYPESPKPGAFYISSDIGTVSSTAYLKGDAAFWDGTAWAKIPFSQAFPADGIQGTGTANKLAKFSGAHGIADSTITDTGSEVDISVPVVVTGNVKASSATIDNGSGGVATVSAQGTGALAFTLPATAGTFELVGADKPADEITYDHTGTGPLAVSLVATDVQAAITELAQGKMAYAGTIAEGQDYPTTPVIGGLYLVTADLTLGATAEPVFAGTDYVKGDWAFYDPTYVGAVGGWTRIPAGYTDAINTSFDPTAIVKPTGASEVATATDVQAALIDLYNHKADLDGSGKVLASQLPASVIGGLQLQGTTDVSAVDYALPVDGVLGHYYIVTGVGATPFTLASAAGSAAVTNGDWIVRNSASSGVLWDVVQGGTALDGLTVGASNLTGVVTLAATGPATVGVASNIVTFGVDKATKLATGVVQVGDAIAVDSNGKISVDAYKGLTIDSTDKKLMLYLNANGLEIDSNSKLGIKASGNFAFTTGTLDLSDTTVVAGTYPKVTVDAKGRVTGGAALLVADVPVYVSGASGATEIYNAVNGKVAGLAIVGPVGISKTGDAITLDFTQTNATTLSSKFAVASPTDFAWSSRTTTTATITSIVGAVNANREDLDQYVALLRTQGAAIGTAAGANLIGTNGISGVTPTSGALGGNANLQAMLEGLKAYTDSALASFDALGVVEVGTTGTVNKMAKFTGADKIGDSSITDDGSAVEIGVPLAVDGNLTVKKIGSTSSALIMQVGGGGSYQTSMVATAAGGNLALSLPSATGVTSGTVLADFSIIDCGDYDL